MTKVKIDTSTARMNELKRLNCLDRLHLQLIEERDALTRARVSHLITIRKMRKALKMARDEISYLDAGHYFERGGSETLQEWLSKNETLPKIDKVLKNV